MVHDRNFVAVTDSGLRPTLWCRYQGLEEIIFREREAVKGANTYRVLNSHIAQLVVLATVPGLNMETVQRSGFGLDG